MVEDSSGPAAMAGIEPGDVILAVNGATVSSPEQLRSLVTKAGNAVARLVRRNDETMYIAIATS